MYNNENILRCDLKIKHSEIKSMKYVKILNTK